MVGPLTSKRKRSEQNPAEQKENAPKKRRGGRKPYTNNAEMVSHSDYDTIEGESKNDKDMHLQRIRRHWVRKCFHYKPVHPRFTKNFTFHTPWGDCREIGFLHASDPQERPPPPPDADESSLKTPASYPNELAKRQKNAKKRAKKAEKDKAREEENRRLIKSDIEKKKAEGKSEGRCKRKHDPTLLL